MNRTQRRAHQHQRRTYQAGEIRVAGDGHTIEAVVLAYNVIDDYNTRFRPGCFTESLEERLPRICWAHRWDEPLGRWVDYRDTATELTLIGELDDFDAVPRARQASAQLMSGTIDQFSVGFMRLADEAVDPEEVDGTRGVVDITKGQLDEASLVLVGAVPGTKLVQVRSGLVVPEDAVVDLAKRVVAGELTKDEAKAALDLLATDDDQELEDEHEETDDGPTIEEVGDELAAFLAGGREALRS
jgi:HK97 family phage prohead protease